MGIKMTVLVLYTNYLASRKRLVCLTLTLSPVNLHMEIHVDVHA